MVYVPILLTHHYHIILTRALIITHLSFGNYKKSYGLISQLSTYYVVQFLNSLFTLVASSFRLLYFPYSESKLVNLLVLGSFWLKQLIFAYLVFFTKMLSFILYITFKIPSLLNKHKIWIYFCYYPKWMLYLFLHSKYKCAYILFYHLNLLCSIVTSVNRVCTLSKKTQLTFVSPAAFLSALICLLFLIKDGLQKCWKFNVIREKKLFIFNLIFYKFWGNAHVYDM